MVQSMEDILHSDLLCPIYHEIREKLLIVGERKGSNLEKLYDLPADVFPTVRSHITTFALLSFKLRKIYFSS